MADDEAWSLQEGEKKLSGGGVGDMRLKVGQAVRLKVGKAEGQRVGKTARRRGKRRFKVNG